MIFLTITILLGLTSSVTSNPIQIRQNPSDTTSIFKPETLAAIDLLTAGYGLSGIVAYTSPKGDGVLTFGNRSVAGDPITPDTHFAIASNSKLFLGTVLVMLSEKNVTLDNGDIWGLDTPLKDFVPGFKMYADNATQLATTNDFLAHRTGLPPHNFAINPQDTPQIWMERLAYLRPNTPFRQTWTYSNTNYAAITYVVELLTGKSYYDILDEYIFQPLKMDSSSDYAALKAGGAEVSEGWLRNGINYTTCFDDIAGDPSAISLPASCVGNNKGIEFWTEGSGQEWGGGGNVIATGNDMVKWSKEILNPTIIPASVLKRIETVTFPNISRPGEGYTIGTVQSTYRGYNISTHDGALPGSNSNFIRIRNESIGVFSLSSDDTYGTAWYGGVQNLILDDLLGILPITPEVAEPDPVLPTPRPANPRPIDNSTFIGSTFLAPGYEPFTLSTLDLTDPKAVSEAGFPVDFLLLDITTLSSLTFAQEILYTRWNQTAAGYLVFTHFDGPLYNVTALTSWPEVGGDGVVGKWWGGATAVFENGGIGFFDGFWGQGDGIRAVEEGVVEAAEVYFAKQ